MKNKTNIMALVIKMTETNDSLTRLFIADRIFELLEENDNKKEQENEKI
jgi:hypothetical protein